jgi:peptidyl-tRNA hydrolase, PTH1 family
MVIDELLRRHRASAIKKASFEGELHQFDSHYLLKPMTFMNLSGRSIAAVKNFYKIDDVIVIHDDLDLPFGALRFKHGGGHGGHNGLKSTDVSISREYLRVRMGIGKPEYKSQVADYVLSPFTPQEAAHVEAWVAQTADAVEELLETPWETVASRRSVKQITLQ